MKEIVMKNVTILAACVALPMVSTSVSAAEYGQGIQFGPERNVVQQQFDHEQYERSHYRSARIVTNVFPLPRLSANAPDRAHNYHRDLHGKVVADCDSGQCRKNANGSLFGRLTASFGKRSYRKHH